MIQHHLHKKNIWIEAQRLREKGNVFVRLGGQTNIVRDGPV